MKERRANMDGPCLSALPTGNQELSCRDTVFSTRCQGLGNSFVKSLEKTSVPKRHTSSSYMFPESDFLHSWLTLNSQEF